MNKLNTYALILAGGKSSRMGTDKALIKLGGVTMLQRAVSFWQNTGIVDKVLISVGSENHFTNLPEHTEPVSDLYEGKGPMVGILSAFEKTDADVLYVSAVDMPNLMEGLLLPIPEEADIAVYKNEGRIEPLFGVYKRSIQAEAKKLLESGNNRMRALLDQVKTSYFSLPPARKHLFDNLNTIEELQRARAGYPPMISIMGWSGSGKTTFMERLIPLLIQRGYRVSAIKHDAHGFEMDKEGKDTWKFAKAGVESVGIIGPNKWAMYGKGSYDLNQMRAAMPSCDLILVEGYKMGDLPKIEIHRKANQKTLVNTDDSLLAVFTDEVLETDAKQYSLTDYEKCADLICDLFLC